MAVAALLPIVGDFEAQAIGVVEESCPVVGGVLGVEPCLGSVDAQIAELFGDGGDIVRRVDAQAEMVQAVAACMPK